MQTPAVGKQPAILCSVSQKKCSGWSQNQKRRFARLPTALHHFDPAVCRLTHQKREERVCVHIYRALSELSRRTFSSCTVTVVYKVTRGRKLCKISDVFQIKSFLILHCIFKFSLFLSSKLDSVADVVEMFTVVSFASASLVSVYLMKLMYMLDSCSFEVVYPLLNALIVSPLGLLLFLLVVSNLLYYL